MRCAECAGSGACDACDGYGCYPDSYPTAGDGAKCAVCSGDGICVACCGERNVANNEVADNSGGCVEKAGS